MAQTNVQAFSGDVDIAGNIDIVGTATVTNLVRGVAEEAVRWNSQNETVFPQSETTRYYKIATLGATGEFANGGKLRISGTIGGFGENSTTLIDAFVASRAAISYGGTLSGYGGDPTGVFDIVVYLESNGTFGVWLKLLRYYTFDLTISGAQVSNNTRTLAVLPCPTTDTSVATPTGTLQGSVVDACSVVFTDDGDVGIGTTDPSMQLEVKGSGQTSTTTFNQAGLVGGTIGLRDSGTSSGNGGAIMFGAGQGYWCAIKGNIIDGGSNTRGSLSFYTRQAIGDATMARQMVINDDGTINSTGGIDKLTLAEDATDTNRRVLFTTGNTGALPVKTDGGLVYNPANNILTTTVTQTQKLYSGAADGQNATYYLPFRSGHNNSYADFYTDQDLYYNPANNTLNVNANSATFANGATFANNATNAGYATNAGHATNADSATNAGHASNAGSSAKLITNSVDTTNANYHIPFRSGHGNANGVDFYCDQNLYYNAANNFINANTPYASVSGNTNGNAAYAGNAGYANSSGYANSAGSAYSTNGGYINGGNHNANATYQLRQGGYNHYIQSSLNTLFVKGYGDVGEYGAVQVLCGSGRGNSYNACDFYSVISGRGINVNGQVRGAGNYVNTSDDRVKYNETTLTDCLSVISALRPLKYEKMIERKEYGTWIPTNEEWETYKTNNDTSWTHEMGFVAQEIKEIPELAFTVTGEEIVNKERMVSVEEYNLLNSNLQIGYTPVHIYLRQIIITNAEYKDLDVDESQRYTIHEIEGYVSGGVTKTIEEYEQLADEERGGYEPFYNYTRNERIDDDEYNALNSEERSQYSNTLTGYSNVIPTQVPLGLDYNSIFTTAVGAIQELNEKVSALETRVTTLEGN
jgi:hypothetical protein